MLSPDSKVNKLYLNLNYAPNALGLPFFHVSVALADDDADAIAEAALGGRPRLSPSLGLRSELLSEDDLKHDTYNSKFGHIFGVAQLI